MAKLDDLTGKQFGLLRVIKRGPSDARSNTRWYVRCACGEKRLVFRFNLLKGDHKSCGCARTKHGLARRGNKMSAQYTMWQQAKRRAKDLHLSFSLKVEDIVIPKICPIFGIRLHKNKKHSTNNSPSLDRIIPTKGYTKKNTWVISMKANRMKSNFTLEELEHLVKVLRRRIHVKP